MSDSLDTQVAWKGDSKRIELVEVLLLKRSGEQQENQRRFKPELLS